ncbi:DNA repair protein XRCC2 isoform X3 [Chelmon rostratus]|uniref:DNA repair protein XRCC2 isoform X3 n=1 Tax=Chelmon rostratus TaxID=109905 RepID=UPI001BEB1C9D|nr:DNA repair protein XRCC2 isoform X3 [Chelmon rostratus]
MLEQSTCWYSVFTVMSCVSLQLFARLEARRCLKDIEPRLFPEDGGPDHGEVVELYGAEGTGKTELLYHLLCRCVLPVATGGLEVEVVFIDTDYSLDMLRLVSILDSRLNAARSTGSPSAGSDEVVLRSCLSRLLVVHCPSSSQLLLTLHFLETSLSSRPGLALLLIDSISAFYWLDRCEGGASIAKQEEKLGKCAELLGRLLRYRGLSVDHKLIWGVPRVLWKNDVHLSSTVGVLLVLWRSVMELCVSSLSSVSFVH